MASICFNARIVESCFYAILCKWEMPASPIKRLNQCNNSVIAFCYRPRPAKFALVGFLRLCKSQLRSAYTHAHAGTVRPWRCAGPLSATFSSLSGGGSSGVKKPDDVLLSHGETPHYHRRCAVSLPSSGWDRVVPTLYARQAKSRNLPKLCFTHVRRSVTDHASPTWVI